MCVTFQVFQFCRFFAYRSINEHFFCVDFCYFLQLSTWLNLLACPSSLGYSDQCQIWFKINYCLALGPIAFAIVAWQNSLVFHSIDKVTSFALHIMPGLTYYLLRWDPRMIEAGLAVKLENLTLKEQFLYPMTFYLCWQLFYFYLQYTIIEKDRTLVTSLRHLVNDRKMPATIWGTRYAVKFGFIKPGENLNPYKLSIILMFALFQFAYMTICLIPTILMYNFEIVNGLYLVLITVVAIVNGGSYYIQIFSQRYNAKFLSSKVESNGKSSDKSD